MILNILYLMAAILFALAAAWAAWTILTAFKLPPWVRVAGTVGAAVVVLAVALWGTLWPKGE